MTVFMFCFVVQRAMGAIEKVGRERCLEVRRFGFVFLSWGDTLNEICHAA